MEEGHVAQVLAKELDEADQLCAQINETLESAENTNTLDEPLLNDSLRQFRECLELDPNSIEARFGIVYVCGHLDRFDEALAELATLKEQGVEEERIAETRSNLLVMKESVGEAGEGEGDGDTEKNEEAEPLVSVDLLIHEGEPTMQFQTVLTEIFKRFDKDKDNALSQRELDAFHRVVNGSPISAQTVKFLFDHFDVSNKGLTLIGFVGFYMSQTIGDREETWKDLGQLGYDKDLNRIK